MKIDEIDEESPEGVQINEVALEFTKAAHRMEDEGQTRQAVSIGMIISAATFLTMAYGPREACRMLDEVRQEVTGQEPETWMN